MGFHFPLSLHEMTAEERNLLDQHLKSLKEEAKVISNKSDHRKHTYTYPDLTLINFLLRRYSAIVFGNIMDTKSRIKPIIEPTKAKCDMGSNVNDLTEPSPIMKMLKDQFAPFVFSVRPMGGTTSYDRQLAKYNRIRYSRLGEGFVTLIGSYMTKVTWVRPESKENDIDFFAVHGLILLNTLNAWIDQEIHLIPDTVSYVTEKAGVAAKAQVSKNANDTKYELLRKFKDDAAKVIEREWKNGSTLLHHKMAKYLCLDYTENNKHPFGQLPDRDKEGNFPSSEKVLRDVAKDVAKKLNRPDLISGKGGG